MISLASSMLSGVNRGTGLEPHRRRAGARKTRVPARARAPGGERGASSAPAWSPGLDADDGGAPRGPQTQQTREVVEHVAERVEHRVERPHRSTSPRIGSTDEITATASAM